VDTMNDDKNKKREEGIKDGEPEARLDDTFEAPEPQTDDTE
jgi:hypothetical protein